MITKDQKNINYTIVKNGGICLRSPHRTNIRVSGDKLIPRGIPLESKIKVKRDCLWKQRTQAQTLKNENKVGFQLYYEYTSEE